MGEPFLSIVMATYNRAHTLPRAVQSVLSQDYRDWELVIVDDGSTDGTRDYLESVVDERVRVVHRPKNGGVTAAKNAGFDHVRGTWTTTVDSDDEVAPGGLAALTRIPREVDPEVEVVGCNCLRAGTTTLTGSGKSADGYMDMRVSLNELRGEHWGMWKTSVLGAHRFNEKIAGGEGILWLKVFEGRRWYYVHRGLLVVHYDSGDRITGRKFASAARDRKFYESYKAMVDDEWWYYERLRDLSPATHRSALESAAWQFAIEGDRERLHKVTREWKGLGGRATAGVLRATVAVSPVIRAVRAIVGARG